MNAATLDEVFSFLELIFFQHDLTIAETGTLQTDARLSDHKATYISLKVDYDTRHAYKRKIWHVKMLTQTN